MASPSLTIVSIDSPLLPDDPTPERRLHFAVAIDDATLGWQPVRVSVANSPNAVFKRSFNIFTEPNVGYALTALPATGPYHQWDRETTLDVMMIEGELLTKSDEEIFSGSNWLWVANGQQGAGEIIAFANADLVGHNRYRLSKLLRGRRGTEDQMSGHSAGDKVVPLDRFVVSQEYTLTQHKRNTFFKVTTQDDDDPDMVAVFGPVYPTSRPLVMFSPVHIRGVRDGSNNLTISWIRRSRYYFNLFSLDHGCPLSAPTESYRVEILDGSNNVLRTITSSSQSAGYLASEQVTDSLTPGSAVSVRVAQRNTDLDGTGWGVPAVASV